MKTQRFNIFVTIAYLLGVAVSLQAQDSIAPPARKPTADKLVANWLTRQDKNGDGKISRSEAVGPMQANFARNDLNKDNYLDREELASLAEGLSRKGLDRRNRNSTNNGTKPERMTTEQLMKRARNGIVIEPDIAYRSGNSKAWRLDLVRPKELGAKPRPAIVFVHGGGWRNGDKRTATFLNGALTYAQSGYICITINYRLADEAPFPACVEDCKCAVRWLRAHAEVYNVDPKRIGGFGNSAGAHLVAMLGLAPRSAGLEGDGSHQDTSSALQAACCAATPTDFLFRPEDLARFSRAGSLLYGPTQSLEERARRASPISYVRKDAPPFLLIHGTVDNTVNVAHDDRFVEALTKVGARDVSYLRIDGAGHGVFNEHAEKTHAAMKAFFARTIGDASRGVK